MASVSSLFREKYDRLVLGLGVLVLLLSLVFILLGAMGRDDAAGDPLPTGRAVAESDLAPIREALARINEPALLTATNLVLVSEPRIACINPNCKKLIRTREETCPFCQTKQPVIGPEHDSDGDGMSDQYELDNGLDRMVKDGEFDFDGDGFTNLEEWAAKPRTAANDPSVHPSMLGKLRMSGVRKSPLYYRLRGLSKSGTVYTFQVNLETLDETIFVKLGQTVKGYNIKNYNAAKETLTIERDGRSIDLPNGKRVDVPRSVAQVVNLIRPQYSTNVTVGAALDLDGTLLTIRDIQDEQILATRPRVEAQEGKGPNPVEVSIKRETEAERALRRAGGKLPSAPERALETPTFSPPPPVYNPSPTPGFERPFTPDSPTNLPEGFGPPPAEVLERIREANRVRPPQ